MSERNWLDELKAGDEAIVASGYGRAVRAVGTVERRDKVKIIVSLPGRFSDWRFSARSGVELGGGLDCNRLEEPTAAALESARMEVRRAQALARIHRARVDSLTVECLEAAADLLDPRPSVSGERSV